MNKKFINFIFLIFFITAFSGCAIIEGIFAAGALTVIIGLLVVIGIIVLIIKAVKK